jgi:hypothetical protein
MAEQQAARASKQNDAEQQRIQNAAGTPSAPAAAGASTSAAPMSPALQAALKNIASLQTDFGGLTAAPTDATQKIALLNDLTQAAQGTKAGADSVKRVANDLSTALAGAKKLTVPQQTKLAREIHALFNSAHLTAAQQTALLNDVQKTLVDGGGSLDDAVDLVTDLKTVVAETK